MANTTLFRQGRPMHLTTMLQILLDKDLVKAVDEDNLLQLIATLERANLREIRHLVEHICNTTDCGMR